MMKWLKHRTRPYKLLAIGLQHPLLLMQFLLRNSKLIKHYRRNYRHFRRYLFLRQCFYFYFSLSCFSALLLVFWLLISTQEWQTKIQRELKAVFLMLEQQHNIHIRFRSLRLNLLQQIQLSDIQVRLNIPNQVPNQGPLDIRESKLQFLPAFLKQMPHRSIAEINAHNHPKNKKAVAQPGLEKPPENYQTLTQLYLQVDNLQLRFELWPLLNNVWQQLYPKKIHKNTQTKQSLESNIQQNESLTEPLSPIFNKQIEPSLKLLGLLQHITKLSLGAVDLKIYTSQLNDLQNFPKKFQEDDQSTTENQEFIWQDFLQLLRVFPIEIHSLQLEFDFWQQFFEGEDIRILFQPDTSNIWKNPALQEQILFFAGSLYKYPWLKNLWNRIVTILPWNYQPLWYKKEKFPDSHSELEQNTTKISQKNPRNYLFELQGKFRGNIHRNNHAKNLAFWGQLHARGGLAYNLSQAYLIFQLPELHSDYGSFQPMEFQIEYQPTALKFQALSKIRTLNWQLTYFLKQQTVDLKLWANNFTLGHYLSYPTYNRLAAKTPLFKARITGQSQMQINLFKKSNPFTLDYQAQLSIWLPQISIAFNGEGNLDGLIAHNSRIWQKNWEAQFSGSLPYHTLLPDGLLNFQWKHAEIGYRGRFLLRRLQQERLLIDTLQSHFIGFGLPENSTLPLLDVKSLLTKISKERANATSPERQLSMGLPPWAQPQLRSLITYDQGNYYANAQLHIPLNQNQLRHSKSKHFGTASTLDAKNNPEPFYYGTPLYPSDSSQNLQQNILDREHSTAPFYLQPILALNASIKKQSQIMLELNSLKWDNQKKKFKDGPVLLSTLLGEDLPSFTELFFPGMNASLLKLNARLFNDDSQNFELWLDELQVEGAHTQQQILLQAMADSKQINLENLKLRWDTLKIDNNFRWDILAKNGNGLLKLQEHDVNYNIKQILLPQTRSMETQKIIEPKDTPKSKPRQQAWLLEGDYQLYAYFDYSKYQVAFQQIPLPTLPRLNLLNGGLTRTTTETLDTEKQFTGHSLLSLKAAGFYPQQSNWQVDVSQFRLEVPAGEYFSQGGELQFIGFLRPGEFQFQRLALLEPQRQLQGQGSLVFIRPLAPILPATSLIFSSVPADLTTQKTIQPKTEVSNPKTMPQPSRPYDKTEISFSKIQPPSLPLPSSWKENLDLEAEKNTSIGSVGYWEGSVSLQGFRTKASQLNITQGSTVQNQNSAEESLAINFHTQGQQFHAQGHGQLDISRFTRLLSLLQGKNYTSLEQGMLKFSAVGNGLIDGDIQSLFSNSLKVKAKNEAENLKPFTFDLQNIQGQWQLDNASYGGNNLELGSEILWNRSDAPIPTDIGLWLFSNIRGKWGQIFLERSFVSFQSTQNYTKQKLAGLLNYNIQLGKGNYYQSSLALSLERNSFSQLASTSDTELICWQGKLYSYPVHLYSSEPTNQAQSSISAITKNLRNQVNVKSIFPGFEMFVKPRIVQTEGPPVGELYLTRRRSEDLEIGIQSQKFWLNVGRIYPISFRAEGASSRGNIEAQIENLSIAPKLLNIFIPRDAVMKEPVVRFEQGRIFGSLKLYGNIFDPAIDGSLQLQNIRLRSPYFPSHWPTLNMELIAEGHIIMAKPFQIAFVDDGVIYGNGYEEAYLRHQTLKINRYYLGLQIEGKNGIPIFYDAYGIKYEANTKGFAILEGNEQGTNLNTDLEFNHLLMQGSSQYNSIEAESQNDPNNQSNENYDFTLNIRAKVGRSAYLVYPQKNSAIFNTQLNPSDELQILYDSNSQQNSIKGRITLYDGELYLLGSQITLRKGELIFDETFEQFSPDIKLFFNLYTYDQQGQDIQINIDYQGDLANLSEQNWSPKLYSQPPLPEQQLRYLVAAQLSSGGTNWAADQTLQQNQLFSQVLSYFGSSVVLKPIEDFVRKEFKLDKVNFQTDLLGNLLGDYFITDYSLGRRSYSNIHITASDSSNWVKYLDNTQLSFGMYIDRNNTILLSLNIDLLYKPQDTKQVLFSRNGLQVIPGLGLKFNTPLLDITWDIGMAHYNDYFITDTSLLLEWSLSKFLSRRRLATFKRDRKNVLYDWIAYEDG